MKAREKNKERDNNITLKVLLYNKDKNVDTLYSFVRVKSLKEMREKKEVIKGQAIKNICNKKGLTAQELLNRGYNTISIKLVTSLKGDR